MIKNFYIRTALGFIFLFSSLVVFGQNKHYTWVFLNKNLQADTLSKEESSKLMKGHMANINRLAIEGKLLAAGPFDGGGGIFVLNTTSTEEARMWLSSDPGIKAKRWHVELYDYQPRVGSLCKVTEPYEMVSYNFYRFDAIISKSTASTFPQIIRKHNNFIKELVKTGNVITEGIFGDNDGGVLIMKGDVDLFVLQSDPGVQEGLLELTAKKLYIAKGSFCEK